MASESSFDIVSKVDLQEVDNAIHHIRWVVYLGDQFQVIDALPDGEFAPCT